MAVPDRYGDLIQISNALSDTASTRLVATGMRTGPLPKDEFRHVVNQYGGTAEQDNELFALLMWIMMMIGQKFCRPRGFSRF
jgi:hypothetical protein